MMKSTHQRSGMKGGKPGPSASTGRYDVPAESVETLGGLELAHSKIVYLDVYPGPVLQRLRSNRLDPGTPPADYFELPK